MRTIIVALVALVATAIFAVAASLPIVRGLGGWQRTEMLFWFWTVFTVAPTAQAVRMVYRARVDRDRRDEYSSTKNGSAKAEPFSFGAEP